MQVVGDAGEHADERRLDLLVRHPVELLAVGVGLDQDLEHHAAEVVGVADARQVEDRAHVHLAQLHHLLRADREDQLGLRDPVDDLEDVVRRLDIEQHRVGGREVLHVLVFQLLQPEAHEFGDAVDHVQRQGVAQGRGVRMRALDGEFLGAAGDPVHAGRRIEAEQEREQHREIGGEAGLPADVGRQAGVGEDGVADGERDRQRQQDAHAAQQERIGRQVVVVHPPDQIQHAPQVGAGEREAEHDRGVVRVGEVGGEVGRGLAQAEQQHLRADRQAVGDRGAAARADVQPGADEQPVDEKGDDGAEHHHAEAIEDGGREPAEAAVEHRPQRAALGVDLGDRLRQVFAAHGIEGRIHQRFVGIERVVLVGGEEPAFQAQEGLGADVPDGELADDDEQRHRDAEHHHGDRGPQRAVAEQRVVQLRQQDHGRWIGHAAFSPQEFEAPLFKKGAALGPAGPPVIS